MQDEPEGRGSERRRRLANRWALVMLAAVLLVGLVFFGFVVSVH